MDVVLMKTHKYNDMVIDLLRIMTAAGRAKLMSHSVEQLPGGWYFELSSSNLAAASILGSASNDIVESCFGVLDREQTRCPVQNPLNKSALVNSKENRRVKYVRAHDEEIKESWRRQQLKVTQQKGRGRVQDSYKNRKYGKNGTKPM